MKLYLLLLPLLITASLNAKDVVLDTTTSLLWQDAPENKDLTLTYYEAQDYCKKLEVKQYKDFRLPTLVELQSIIDYSNYKSAVLNGFNYADNETYWTTTPFADDSSEVWTINFKKGERTVKGKHYTRNLRCVQKIKK
ncbi:MAG: DUF1566 domain-containing protein [Campylobacterota bacterium]|nr:DUF1566 domain-containing protein [Campylobacterota bacterium]